MMTTPFLIPIQNYHSSGHCTCDIELNIDFDYCLEIFAIFEIITTIYSFVVNLKVRSPGASELHLKMYFDACSENDVNHDVVIFAFISKRSKFE